MGHSPEDDPVMQAKTSLIKAVYLFRLIHKKRAGQYLQGTILTSTGLLEEVTLIQL